MKAVFAESKRQVGPPVALVKLALAAAPRPLGGTVVPLNGLPPWLVLPRGAKTAVTALLPCTLVKAQMLPVQSPLNALKV